MIFKNFYTRIIKLSESGIYNHWVLKTGIRELRVDNSNKWMDDYSHIDLDMKRLKGVYYLWIIGLICSFAIITCELLVMLNLNNN